jgi:hypothetical protein
VTGLESFRPWLDRIDALSHGDLQELASLVPEEWCAGSECDALYRLLGDLHRSKYLIPIRIKDMQQHTQRIFQNWRACAQ